MENGKEVFPLETPFTRDQIMWLEDAISKYQAGHMALAKQLEIVLRQIRGNHEKRDD